MKGGEGIRKHKGEESYGCSLRVETAGVSAIDDRNLSKSYIQIEEDLNNYLKSINYSNEKLIEVLLILIIRNDDFSATGGEECRKLRGEPKIGVGLRIDYNEFKNGNFH
jgi:hypothetical protein